MRLIKLTSQTFENIDIPNDDIIYKGYCYFNKKLEECFIHGLKRKGFEFKDKSELEAFIKEHCRVEDNVDLKERIYYVYDIPFFSYNYKSELQQMLSPTDIQSNITINLGTYTYL